MVVKSFFGDTPSGDKIYKFKITNAAGSSLTAISYGAIIQSIVVPDKHGVFMNVVLNYNTLPEYLADTLYVGAIVGRFANRIAKGMFSMDGKSYSLYRNDRGNHLHGGLNGFNRVLWTVEIISDNSIKLSYRSPDGEEGYPGNLLTEFVYTLTEMNEVRMDIKATTDKATPVNLVQHSYFNLSTHQNILDHSLTINSLHYLPVNNAMIPTGDICTVENTPFDFITSTTIGSRIADSCTQLQYGNGYDHCWVLNHPNSGINKVATLMDVNSGRVLELYTDKPGLHIYTGNFLRGSFQPNSGICLETEYFPDSPNQPNFPITVLRPGEQYKSCTIFKFSIQ